MAEWRRRDLINPRRPQRRGSVIVIVVWAVAIAAIIVGAAQVLAFRQAAMGRESIAKVEARWAARAGIEESIAILEYHTEEPDPLDSRQMYKDLEKSADGEVESGTWEIRHTEDGVEVPGPQDEHAKININLMSQPMMLGISGMTMDVSDAVLDWRDADEEARLMGAEREFYVNRNMGFEPRNADLRSIAELELVAGAFPSSVRGEDANLNGRLDPNENDGALTAPPDDADGLLDAGWSGAMTARSAGSLLGASGEPKLNLKKAGAEEVQERFGVTAEQAASLVSFAKQPSAKLEMLLTQDLATLSQSGGRNPTNQAGSGSSSRSGRQSGRSASGASGQAQNSRIQPLDNQQLRRIFQEGTFDDGSAPILGKVNLNTAPPSVIRALLPEDTISADAILSIRNASSTGLLSISDLRGSSRITEQALAAIAPLADTQSNVFTITSRGRSASTGLEVEITAVVDRSTLPARILEYREQ